jgi:2,4-dichlorophenol 6-monooxygenase
MQADRQQVEERKANTLGGRAKREAPVAAMELKDYEFNSHRVDRTVL